MNTKQTLLTTALIAFLATKISAEQVEDFARLSHLCAPFVHKDTMTALVSVESGFNPYAIGVVDGRLSRQPKNMTEALDVVKQLEEQEMNYSLGLAQVNKHNLAKYGLDAERAFDPCKNLEAGAKILSECYIRARKGGHEGQAAIQAALSCYYSGNFSRGFKDGYVQEVVARASQTSNEQIKIIKGSRKKPSQKGNKEQKETPKEDKQDPAFVF